MTRPPPSPQPPKKIMSAEVSTVVTREGNKIFKAGSSELKQHDMMDFAEAQSPIRFKIDRHNFISSTAAKDEEMIEWIASVRNATRVWLEVAGGDEEISRGYICKSQTCWCMVYGGYFSASAVESKFCAIHKWIIKKTINLKLQTNNLSYTSSQSGGKKGVGWDKKKVRWIIFIYFYRFSRYLLKVINLMNGTTLQIPVNNFPYFLLLPCRLLDKSRSTIFL